MYNYDINFFLKCSRFIHMLYINDPLLASPTGNAKAIKRQQPGACLRILAFIALNNYKG